VRHRAHAATLSQAGAARSTAAIVGDRTTGSTVATIGRVSRRRSSRDADAREILLLSYYYPPMSIGPAFVLSTILGAADADRLTIFSGNPETSTIGVDETLKGPGRVRRFDVPRWWPHTDVTFRRGRLRLPLRVRALGNVLVSLRLAAATAAHLRRDEVAALVVVYPKQNFLLAGLLAGLMSRKPLLVYFTDVYVEGLHTARRMATLIERLVARRANAVFVMSEPHAEHVRTKWQQHGVPDPVVVELPHPFANYDDGDDDAPAALPGRPSILFTGAIYDAQADAVARLVEALDSPELREFDPHLTILTQTPLEELAGWGIAPSTRVAIRQASRSETRRLQRAADVLFLPIAFGAVGEVARTAAPSKLPEYLASGTPILVHAPPDAYVTGYARERRFADVVDVPDTATLAAAIRLLADDDAHRAEVTAGAAQTLERHRAEAVAAIFVGTVDSVIPR
jgi:glycosyltransferase involved in cell wall biosynthesis